MFKFLLPVALAISLPLTSCSSKPQATAAPAQLAVEEVVAEPAPAPNYYQMALDLGYEAAVASQSAKTAAEWQEVERKWGNAYSMLENIVPGHPDHEKSLAKDKEYRAAAKVAYERRLAAQEPVRPVAPARPTASSDLVRLREAVAALDPTGSAILKVEIRNEQFAVFTMSGEYLAANDDVKLEVAKGLWKVWAAIHNPTDPDKAYVELRSAQGTKLASSGWLGGSMVKLEKK